MGKKIEKIRRTVLREETVEVPEGHLVCAFCGGKGMLSAYDRGVRSLTHSARLAAKEECHGCRGRGYVEDFGDDT